MSGSVHSPGTIVTPGSVVVDVVVADVVAVVVGVADVVTVVVVWAVAEYINQNVVRHIYITTCIAV